MQTLLTLFRNEENLVEFLMAWNRRIDESNQFFDLMKEAGFYCFTHGKGIFSFYLPSRMDPYLQSLQ